MALIYVRVLLYNAPSPSVVQRKLRHSAATNKTDCGDIHPSIQYLYSSWKKLILFWERPTCIRGSSDMQRLLGLARNQRAHPHTPNMPKNDSS